MEMLITGGYEGAWGARGIWEISQFYLLLALCACMIRCYSCV